MHRFVCLTLILLATSAFGQIEECPVKVLGSKVKYEIRVRYVNTSTKKAKLIRFNFFKVDKFGEVRPHEIKFEMESTKNVGPGETVVDHWDSYKGISDDTVLKVWPEKVMFEDGQIWVNLYGACGYVGEK